MNIRYLIQALSENISDKVVYIDQSTFPVNNQVIKIDGSLVRVGTCSFRCRNLKNLLLTLRDERILFINDEVVFNILHDYKRLSKEINE